MILVLYLYRTISWVKGVLTIHIKLSDFKFICKWIILSFSYNLHVSIEALSSSPVHVKMSAPIICLLVISHKNKRQNYFWYLITLKKKKFLFILEWIFLCNTMINLCYY